MLSIETHLEAVSVSVFNSSSWASDNNFGIKSGPVVNNNQYKYNILESR
jgi:hypothetical protein